MLDPNALDPNGTTAIDFFVPSLDGRSVAVSLSEGGSEAGTRARLRRGHRQGARRRHPARQRRHRRRQRRVERGRHRASSTRAIRASGERAAGGPRLLPAGLLPRARHADEADTYALGKEFPRIAEIRARSASDDGRSSSRRVANGDGGEFASYYCAAAGQGLDADRALRGRASSQARFGADGALYLLSRKGAPRGRILRARRPAQPSQRRRRVVPAGETASSSDFSVDARRASTSPSSSAAPRGCASSGSAGQGGRAEVADVPLPISAVDVAWHALAGDDVLFEQRELHRPPGLVPLRRRDEEASRRRRSAHQRRRTSRDVEVVRETCSLEGRHARCR